MRLLCMTTLFVVGNAAMDVGIIRHDNYLSAVGVTLLMYWVFGAARRLP